MKQIVRINKTFIDMTPPRYHNAASHSLPYGPLSPNVMSSIKPEVHNVSQRHPRRTKPQPPGSAQKFCEDRSSGSREMLTDRQTQTDRHTDKLIAILSSPTGAELVNSHLD